MDFDIKNVFEDPKLKKFFIPATLVVAGLGIFVYFRNKGTATTTTSKNATTSSKQEQNNTDLSSQINSIKYQFADLTNYVKELQESNNNNITDLEKNIKSYNDEQLKNLNVQLIGYTDSQKEKLNSKLDEVINTFSTNVTNLQTDFNNKITDITLKNEPATQVVDVSRETITKVDILKDSGNSVADNTYTQPINWDKLPKNARPN